MSQLINRDIKVVAGPLTIRPRTTLGANQPALKMEISSESGLSRDPNDCEIKIYNLSKNSRAKLETNNIPVIIEAGYIDEISEIFKGTLHFGSTFRTSTEWITTLQVGDGAKNTKTSRINTSFRGGTPVGQVLQTVADAMGLDVGNLKEKVASNGARSILKEFVSGVVLSGKASDAMDQVTKSLGLSWSSQGGKLQLLSKKEVTSDPPIVLSGETGLIGSPEVGEDGVVKAKSLLNGKIFPGRQINITSDTVVGSFRVEKIRHKADTWGSEWSTEILEASPL